MVRASFDLNLNSFCAVLNFSLHVHELPLQEYQFFNTYIEDRQFINMTLRVHDSHPMLHITHTDMNEHFMLST